MELLFQGMTEQQYGKGEVIFRENNAAYGIFFILKGKVKKYKADKTGKEQIIYVANSGEIIGYHAVVLDERYPDSAATLEQSTIAFIPRESFLRAMEQSPRLAQRLLKNLCHEFVVFSNTISLLAQHTVKERLAVTLILLREKFKEDHQDATDIGINISRADLANMVGTGTENIVRFLTELKSDGIITTNGRKIYVQDVKRLIALSGCGNL
ncbi:Crp/Fnr family transcriptional regulator [Chitinophaga sp. Cy-1792]|uniref:Crp/Fnr family transcriptional regulator n=1 Tax=Chitinophaga sp. Cy-1792 TaxID=2608339 RepID=UPI001F04C4AC|nr:Crp/Fnr family transcriptional regulator [Chitinophaga sp. Cy-1792]